MHRERRSRYQICNKDFPSDQPRELSLQNLNPVLLLRNQNPASGAHLHWARDVKGRVVRAAVGPGRLHFTKFGRHVHGLVPTTHLHRTPQRSVGVVLGWEAGVACTALWGGA